MITQTDSNEPEEDDLLELSSSMGEGTTAIMQTQAQARTQIQA